MPDKIIIDYTRYAAKHGTLPGDGAVATWTFDIDGETFAVYGSFAEACAKAKLYVRLYDASENQVVLVDRSPRQRLQLESLT